MTIQGGVHTDKGPRPNNQDAVRVSPELGYAAVADGMGGAAGGAEASRMAIELTDWLLQRELAEARRSGSIPGLLARLFEDANRWIHQKGRATPGLRGMGTTLVVLVLTNGRFHVAHAGDSRAYVLRGGALRQITKDHSLVQVRVDAGLILPEDAASQPDRNVITRAVGVDAAVEPDLSDGEALGGDTFVLTTDGVHGVVPASRLCSLASAASPQTAAEALVREALTLKTTDNATAAVLRASGSPPTPPPEAPPPAEAPGPVSLFQRLLNFGR